MRGDVLSVHHRANTDKKSTVRGSQDILRKAHAEMRAANFTKQGLHSRDLNHKSFLDLGNSAPLVEIQKLLNMRAFNKLD